MNGSINQITKARAYNIVYLTEHFCCAMQQSPIICVNASKSIERWPWEGGPYRPYFWEGGGWLFFFMEAHCAPLRKQHTHLVLASRPRFTCRDTGISLIFSCPSLPRGKSLAVTQFTFSKFTLCQKISVPCVSFQNLHWIYIYIYIGVENRVTRKKRGCPVYLWKMTRKEYLIFPPFLLCRVKLFFKL